MYAGFLSRFMAFMLDVVLLLTIAGVIRLTIRALWDFFGNILPFLNVVEGSLALNGIGIVFTAALQVVYFVFFWTAIGQTPGMTLMGLEVMRHDGTRPTVVSSLIRYVGYWVSAIPLGLGFLWVLIDRQRQCWHDKMSGTFVVYSAAARQYHQQLQAAKLRTSAPQQTLADVTRP
jgi:uncharacterized RDD family membrane protein YckC